MTRGDQNLQAEILNYVLTRYSWDQKQSQKKSINKNANFIRKGQQYYQKSQTFLLFKFYRTEQNI